ncbi:hypothetical protein GOP47_0002469 [Adiantum capillus-veneris]|uniref:MACPF domain-containing protein n=1 Tax=Adiantum capillus-veneris TaxID=13818 RepID=A0A9D4VA57_ADICA|nr:hypothetical protein GOP47_0002469 [Adiantum capillus-veneris]
MASEREAARNAALAAVESLGCGFDLTSDCRLKYRKGPLLQLQHNSIRDLTIPGGITIPDISRDVKCDKGERMRFASEVMQFQQMSQWFNQNASVEGKIPLGLFNAMFDLSGCWQDDASQIKNLAFDGCFITLYKLYLTRSNLVLQDAVINDIPSVWDPQGLARFIEKYGTHIIVSASIGGQDVLYLKENQSSLLSPQDIHKQLKSAGEDYFLDNGAGRSLNVQDSETVPLNILKSQASRTPVPLIHSAQLLISNRDFTILSQRRGGHYFCKSHSEWQETVNVFPEANSLSFVPITSLLLGVAGCGFLQHAINLYLRYKPPVSDIQYFLDFQVPRQWIPSHNELPLRLARKQAFSPSLQFSFMGSKLYVNTSEVIVDKKPVTGLRLFLEGRKSNRVAIHLQHLSVLPQSLRKFWTEDTHKELLHWNGSNDAAKEWFEPVEWKCFSHVCTQPVKYKPEWLDTKGSAFVVTGARLEVKVHGLKSVLHLHLQFSNVPGCVIQRSRWDQPPAAEKSSFFSSLSTTFSSTARPGKKGPQVVVDSAVFVGGPPRPIQSPMLLKYVDTTELTRGPQDAPGHWVVTAARLEREKRKISLRVKFSLLSYMEWTQFSSES